MIPADHWHDNGDGTAWWAPDPGEWTDYGSILQELDRPCDTCGGMLEPGEPVSIDGVECCEPFVCLDCHGTGRHTFTVEVGSKQEVCPQCKMNSIGASISGDAVKAWRCLGCDYRWVGAPLERQDTRTHRVSVVPDTVLPIYDHDELLDGAVSLPRDWAPHIDIMCGEPLLCTRNEKYPEDWDEDRITLPPAAAPGMWALKVEVHS
jgi:hypothetical protein